MKDMRPAKDFSKDDVWLLRADSRDSLLNGRNPVDAASEYSDASPDICHTKEEYSFGVLFDLAVELSSKLVMPKDGKWKYSVKYMDSDAIALCGADRSRTVLFDKPEKRTIGVLDTSFGKLQLNSIYEDGVYRFELGSKYPLDGLPDELKDWGVEFDLSIPPDAE